MPKRKVSNYAKRKASDTWCQKNNTFEIAYPGTDVNVMQELIAAATKANKWANHTLIAEADGSTKLEVVMREATTKYAIVGFVRNHTPEGSGCKVTVKKEEGSGQRVKVKEEEDASMPPQSLQLTASANASPQLAPFSIASQHFHPSPALVAKFMCSNYNTPAADKYIGLDTVGSDEWSHSPILGEGVFGRVRNKGNALLME